jgi:hypothetical protein
MITWTQFEQQAPDLAKAGREQLYAFDVALGFLATVRRDGGPRVHPVCPVISPVGLHVLIVGGPKLGDLRRDRCLLMLTRPTGPFPDGPTIWRASS